MEKKCCVRECNSTHTREYDARGVDNRGRSVPFIVQLCNRCKAGISEKKVHYTFSHAGGVVFVAEIY